MAGSVNRVTLIGNLGRDVEVRSTQGGMKVANLAIATSESWTDKSSGERQERTEWHRVVIMNERLVEVAERYLRKGSKVYVEGKLQTRKWTDQSGQERYTTEVMVGRFNSTITLLDRANNNDDEGGRPSSAQPPKGTSAPSASRGGGGRQNNSSQSTGSWGGGSNSTLDDDIPFAPF